MDFINGLGTVLENISEHVLPHAPFLGVTFILLVIGHRLSTRVFTKSRAYRFYGPGPQGKWKWRFFYWGRETLPMQPILAGVVIGLLWRDPEGLGWNRAASVAYFASSGAISMMLWAVMKAWAKKKGLVLLLPGESEPPVGIQPESLRPYDDVPALVAPTLDEASRVSAFEDNEERAPTLRPLPPPPRLDPNLKIKFTTITHSPEEGEPETESRKP